MWYNLLINTKQGKAFHKDRSLLMNLLVNYKDSEDWEDIAMIS